MRLLLTTALPVPEVPVRQPHPAARPLVDFQYVQITEKMHIKKEGKGNAWALALVSLNFQQRHVPRRHTRLIHPARKKKDHLDELRHVVNRSVRFSLRISRDTRAFLWFRSVSPARDEIIDDFNCFFSPRKCSRTTGTSKSRGGRKEEETKIRQFQKTAKKASKVDQLVTNEED